MGLQRAKNIPQLKLNNETKTFVMKSKFDSVECGIATTNGLFGANVIDILMNLNQIEKSI